MDIPLRPRALDPAQPDTQVASIYFIFTLHETTLVSRFIAKIVVTPSEISEEFMEPENKKIGRCIPKTIHGFMH